MTSIQPIASTPDMPRMRAFYERVLGATPGAHSTDFYVELRVGATTLGLVKEEDAQNGIFLSAEVDDVDALLPVVEAAGGKVTGGPTDMPWGQRVAHVLDPDGNMLNLTQSL